MSKAAPKPVKSAPKPETLAVVEPPKSSISDFSSGIAIYKESADVLIPAIADMESKGEAHGMAKLRVGYGLAVIRQGKHGALQTFIKLATAGHLGRSVSRYSIVSSLAFFDEFLATQNISKKNVPQIEATPDLWCAEPPKDADELLMRMANWVKEEGARTLDHQMLTHQSGDDLDSKTGPNSTPPKSKLKSGSKIQDEQQAHDDAVKVMASVREELATGFIEDLDPSEIHDFALFLQEWADKATARAHATKHLRG